MKFKKRPIWAFLIFILILLGLFIFWPLPDALVNPENSQPLKILDRNGELLYEVRQEQFGTQNYKTLEDIPQAVIDVLLAVEDKTFYSHPGVSLRGIVRAFLQNRRAGKIVSGASTITMQLVKNRLRPEERTYFYKIKEALLALKLEWRMNKDEILEAYLNDVYFGHQAYGIQAAAQTFFDKNAEELSLAEITLLIGLIQSPSSYDPFLHFDRAKERQKVVIGMLEDKGQVGAALMRPLLATPIHLGSGRTEIKAPHFVMGVLENVQFPMSNFQKQSNTITTTLDLDLQNAAEQIVTKHLATLEDKNVTSAAVVVLDAHNGDVLAMVGSADYFDTEHDGAVNVATSPRQPGSALKPFTYALALKQGATAATTVADIETQFFTQDGNPYTPRNYDYGYHGLVRYREALSNSYNIAAVKVLERVGVQSLMDFLKKAGLTTLTETPEHYGLALTLGDAEVKLLELTEAYGMLARGGKTLSARFFLDAPVEPGQRILDEKTAWLITDILDDDQARLPQFGQGGPLEFDFPVAAKTGTTRNSRDNWTLGYTPDRVVGVWVGNADNSPMLNTSGITGAGPIFHDVMLAAVQNLAPATFKRPADVHRMTICKLSGLLPTDYCPHTIEEWFIGGTEPREEDNIFRPTAIDTRNDLLASETCPSEFVEDKVFAYFPPELQTWARENGWELPPRDDSPLCPSEGQKKEKSGSWILIQKPSPSESYLLDPMVPDENEKVVFEATASPEIKNIEWWVDDIKVGEGLPPSFRYEWPPKTGQFKVQAKAGELIEGVFIKID